MYLSIQACGFINGEMFWYLIKDGGSEDIGKQNIFLRGEGGDLKKDEFKMFPSDSESLKTSYWRDSEIHEH